MFDSGVGGLSVLRAIRRALPHAPLSYVADSAFAPYGERNEAEILQRSLCIVDHLQNRGATLVVVACNTATAVAIDTLRERHPDLAFVGVEPGIRPAVAASRRRCIAVLATQATLRSERFAALVRREAADCRVHLQACPGLAAAIERGRFDDAELHALLRCHTGPVRASDADVAVLGCTHYAFVRGDIQRLLRPGVTVIDTADAVAAQVARRWDPAVAAPSSASCRLETTGDPSSLRGFAHTWLDIDTAVLSSQPLEL